MFDQSFAVADDLGHGLRGQRVASNEDIDSGTELVGVDIVGHLDEGTRERHLVSYDEDVGGAFTPVRMFDGGMDMKGLKIFGSEIKRSLN